MQPVIRQAKDDDFDAIGRLFFETIRSVNLRDYTPEQAAAWAPAVWNGEEWRKRLQGQVVLVAAEGPMVVGFVSIEPNGHVDFLYVHKDRQRRGIGSALLGRVVDAAFARGVSAVFTESSITAKPLFEKMGFEVVEPEDVVRSGVSFHRYVMRLDLAKKKVIG